MRRKAVQLIGMLALVIFIAPLAANAQPLSKVYRLGWLSDGSPRSSRQGCKSKEVKVLCRQLPGSDG